MQVGEDYTVTVQTTDGLGLGLGQSSKNPGVMTDAADKEQPLIFFLQLLKMVSHVGFPQKVFMCGLSAAELFRIGLTVSGVAHTLNGIRIGKGFVNLWHRLQVSINQVEGEVVS